MVARGQEDRRELRDTGPQSGARCWPGRERPRLETWADWGDPGWGWRGAELVERHALCEVLKGPPHTGCLPRHCSKWEPRGQRCSLNS